MLKIVDFHLLLKTSRIRKDKNVGKNVTKNLSSKYSQQLLDSTKKYVTDSLQRL